jgi:thioredoxin 1
MNNYMMSRLFHPKTKRLALAFIAPTFLLGGVLALHEKRIEAHELPTVFHDKDQELVTEISETDFKKLALDSSKPVLIDFFATWCYPCKKLGPVVSDVSREYAAKASFYRIDVDKNPELATKYQIDGIPALKIFKGGKVVAESVGLQSRQEISSMLDRAISIR